MKILKDAAAAAAELPIEMWIVAAIVPGGFVAIGAYSTLKAYLKGKKK